MFLNALPARTLCIANSCSCAVLVMVLSACTGGHTATMDANGAGPAGSEHLSNNDIAGISPALAAYADQKRRAEDPIYVNLLPAVLDRVIRRAEKSKGAIEQHLRGEFAADPIIQLLPEPKSKLGRKTSQSVEHTADVEVTSTVSVVSVDEILGRNSATGKSSKVLRVVFEATITSQSPPVTYVVSEAGSLLQHRAVSKRFANQIREVIVGKIGPEIPAR